MVDFFATKEDPSTYPPKVIFQRRGSILSRGRVERREEGAYWFLHLPLGLAFSQINRSFSTIIGQFLSLEPPIIPRAWGISDCAPFLASSCFSPDGERGVSSFSCRIPLGFQFTSEHSLLVDIETTGLSQQPLFLIGFLWWSSEGLNLYQLLARCYEEEAAILASATEIMSRFSGIISFNGRKFDLPYLQSRAGYYGLSFHPPPIHIDVLELARRNWRPLVPNCQLQTLERHFCQRIREGDVPSHLIPQIYNLSVERRDPSLLEEVLFHNFLDLLTSVELFCYLAPFYKE